MKNKRKKKEMANVYFETTTTNQLITKVNGNNVPPQPVTQYATNHGWDWYDENESDYYPSLIAPDTISSVTVSVDGTLTGQLIGGGHPPRRPK